MKAVLGAGSAEAAGLTAAGLARLDAALGELIAAGELAGVLCWPGAGRWRTARCSG